MSLDVFFHTLLPPLPFCANYLPRISTSGLSPFPPQFFPDHALTRSVLCFPLVKNVQTAVGLASPLSPVLLHSFWLVEPHEGGEACLNPQSFLTFSETLTPHIRPCPFATASVFLLLTRLRTRRAAFFSMYSYFPVGFRLKRRAGTSSPQAPPLLTVYWNWRFDTSGVVLLSPLVPSTFFRLGLDESRPSLLRTVFFSDAITRATSAFAAPLQLRLLWYAFTLSSSGAVHVNVHVAFVPRAGTCLLAFSSVNSFYAHLSPCLPSRKFLSQFRW